MLIYVYSRNVGQNAFNSNGRFVDGKQICDTGEIKGVIYQY